MKPIRVGALIQGFEVPSSRYRILQYFPLLEAEGIACEARPFSESVKGWKEEMAWVRSKDLLWLHRKRPSPFRLPLLRRSAKRIVYDVDDAVMYRDTLSLGKQLSRSRQARFKDTVQAADWVVAGNRYLEAEARRHTERVSVLPTALDLAGYSPRAWPGKASGPVVMGWIGDTGSVAYLDQQRPLFEAIGQACPKLVFRVLSSRFPRYDHLRVEEVPWRREIEAETLRSFDIGVMPMPDDPWSKGKCALKLLQYMASGVPAVASPVGMNADVIRDGENGFSPGTVGGWISALQLLAGDPALRARIGAAGRATVEEGYTLSVTAPRLAGILRAVAAGKRPA